MQSSALWYLLYCKPRQENRAQLHLANQGYSSFVPFITINKLKGDRWQVVTEPLFPRYLFLNVPSDIEMNISAIRSTRGISDFVRFGNKLAQVPTELIATLTQQQVVQCRQTPAKPLNKGDAINIINGPFSDLEAVFDSSDGELRSSVLIRMLGKWAQVSLDNSQITPKK